VTPTFLSVGLGDQVWFSIELVPRDAQTHVRATVTEAGAFPDPTKLLFGKYKRPLVRFVDSLKRSRRLI
jgi:hypothetical protein